MASARRSAPATTCSIPSAAWGVAACHGGVIGDGPWAAMIDAALRRDGIRHIGMRCDGEDNGFCIALTDARAERTFISCRGAEAHAPADAFDAIEPGASDVLYVSGYTLAHRTAEALRRFLRRTMGHRFAAVVDASPVIDAADMAMLRQLRDYAPVWTCNEREAGLLMRRFGLDGPHGSGAEQACRRLAEGLGSPVIVRAGGDGAWMCEPGAGPRHVAGFPVAAVDTNGAGDCHTGVLCAELTRGTPLPEAVRTANAAAAIAVTRRGPATCPSRQEVRALFGADTRRRHGHPEA